jgi:broad specificity phosphatase PhoE
VDEDPGRPETVRTRNRIVRLLGQDVFIQAPNLEGLFGFTRKLTQLDAITELPEWFDNTSNDVPEVYARLAARLREVLSLEEQMESDDDVVF